MDREQEASFHGKFVSICTGCVCLSYSCFLFSYCISKEGFLNASARVRMSACMCISVCAGVAMHLHAGKGAQAGSFCMPHFAWHAQRHQIQPSGSVWSLKVAALGCQGEDWLGQGQRGVLPAWRSAQHSLTPCSSLPGDPLPGHAPLSSVKAQRKQKGSLLAPGLCPN